MSGYGEGQEGVRVATDSELRGRVQESRAMGVEAGFRNPGATPNLRGVEANTARSKGTPIALDPDGTKESSELDIGGTSMTEHNEQPDEAWSQ
jgi:hypothetical protein